MKLTHPQSRVIESNCERNLFHSGQGGGKSALAGLLALDLVKVVPNVIGLIAANTYGQLSNATLLAIFEIWNKAGVKEYTEGNPNGCYVIDKQPPKHFKAHGYTFKNNNNKIFFSNGAVVFTASLDNYKALDGITIGWAILDETKDTKEDAVKKVIIGRLRQKGMCKRVKEVEGVLCGFVPSGHDAAGEQANPLFVFTSPAKEQWLTEFFKLEDYREEILACIFSKADYFCKRENNRCIVIASNYHNEENLPKSYIPNMIADLSADIIELNIYGSPFGKTGAEYYADFKKSTHVTERAEFTAGVPLKLAWDFNVNPYMTLQVWQDIEKDGRIKSRCIKEYPLRAPRNTIQDCCTAFERDFDGRMWAGVFFYGDSSGKARTVIKSVKSLYAEIERCLRQYLHSTSRRILKSNPRHRSLANGTLGRRDFMNKLLRGGYGVDVEIHPSCKHTIADFEFCKEDANGAKEKKKVVINGISCEKYGHMSDAADAKQCYDFGQYAKE